MTRADGRVLICGSRRWPWPATVEHVLDRLTRRHGDQLVVIEGRAEGADRAAHDWCRQHGLPDARHRCHPVDWATARRTRPHDWKLAGPERNTHMLLHENPGLVVGFHDHFSPATGGTSDMALKALLRHVPFWLIPGPDPDVGRWLSLDAFPRQRLRRAQADLVAASRRPDCG